MTEAEELALFIVTELNRQANQINAGYIGCEVSLDENGLTGIGPLLLDGTFDAVELAQAILERETPEPSPRIVTDVPVGLPLVWSEYLHKDWMLNMNQRLHYRERNDRTQLVKTMGRVRHRKLERYRRAKLDIMVSYPARFSADVHNYMPTAKAYVDGLVDIPDTKKGMKKQPARGILIDDSDAYLAGPFLHPGVMRSDRPDHFRFDCTLQPMK